MAYGDLDQFDLYRNTRYNLPRAMAEKFVTSKEINDRLDEGESPVDLSILKWRRLSEILDYINQRTSKEKYLHNFKGKIGYKSCALCISSMRIYKEKHGQMQHKRQKCTYCPLAKVDCCLNHDSAYYQVDLIVQKFYDTGNQLADQDYIDFEKNIRKMLANLEAIKQGQGQVAKPAAEPIKKPEMVQPVAAQPQVKVKVEAKPAPSEPSAVKRLDLAEGINERFLTPRDVAERLNRGEDPVAVTKLKWQRFAQVIDLISAQSSPEQYVHNFKGKIGLQSSALCLSSLEKYNKLYGEAINRTDKCRVCPLARLDCCLVSGSSFERVVEILHRWHEQGATAGAVRKELVRLRALVQNLLTNLTLIGKGEDLDESSPAHNELELPKEISSLFLTSKQVATSLAEGKSAVELTLLKWQRLYEVFEFILAQQEPARYMHSFKTVMGQFTSALCVTSIDKYTSLYGEITRRGDKCKVCALAKVERCIDKGSTYYNIDRSLHRFYDNQVHPVAQEIEFQDLQRNIQKLIANLKSLTS